MAGFIGVLTVRVEIVVAVGPTELRQEREERVEECPGNDHHVVDHYEQNDDQGAITEALECRRHTFERLVRAEPGILSNSQFQKKYR